MRHDDNPDTRSGDKGPMKNFLECIARQLADRWKSEISIEELGESNKAIKPDSSTDDNTTN